MPRYPDAKPDRCGTGKHDRSNLDKTGRCKTCEYIVRRDRYTLGLDSRSPYFLSYQSTQATVERRARWSAHAKSLEEAIMDARRSGGIDGHTTPWNTLGDHNYSDAPPHKRDYRDLF